MRRIHGGIAVAGLRRYDASDFTRPSPLFSRPSSKEKINAVKRLAVSTGQLKPLLALHTRPIDLVVFQEPSHQRCGRPRLAEGFTLICLQRLSWPYVTTLRCRERDNRHIRGTSLPILSY